MLTSSNGVNWSETAQGSDGVTGVTYGNGTFVTVRKFHCSIGTSSDAITWSVTGAETPAYLDAVTYGNNIFLAGFMRSPDGIHWTGSGSTLSADIFAITYGNGTFVAVGKVTYASMGSWYAAELFLLGIVISIRFQRKRKMLFLFAILLIAATLFISCGGGGGGGGRTSPTNGGPPPVGSDEMSHTVSALKNGTTYYWKVVADDGKGGITESDVWSFSTK
jgi:hypothetical protein